MSRRVQPEMEHFVLESALTEGGVGLLFGTAEDGAVLPGGGGAGAANIAGIFDPYGTLATASSGDRVDLATRGYVMARVNGNSVNIAKGDKLKIAATTGRFVKAATDKDYYFLEAQQAATADGVLISCLITRGHLGA